MCETCLYNKNCQFLAKHPKTIVDGCTVYKDATNVVEVVRCKDCEWRDTDGCSMSFYDDTGECFTIAEENDFCSRGERKNDG